MERSRNHPQRDEVVCYLPDKRTVLVEKRTDNNSLLAALPSYSESLESHYSIEKVGKVAKTLGRRTQMIVVQPRDQYRYGYRLWLDQETAMPLKSQLSDRNGRVIEQILFAELNLRDRIPVSRAQASAYRGRLSLVASGSSACARRGDCGWRWSVIRLPAGFRLTNLANSGRLPVRVRRFGISCSRTAWLRCRCSSNLATPRLTPMHGLARVGAAFAYSRDLEGHQVTAVGEVPAATVEAIAAGVTRDRTAALQPQRRRRPGKPDRCGPPDRSSTLRRFDPCLHWTIYTRPGCAPVRIA